MIRKALDSLYRISGGLAAAFMAAIAVVVLLQVGANAVDALFVLTTGQAIGLVVPSYAEFAGFFLAASSFLALAYTLRLGGHIRVSLFLSHLPPRAARALEFWCCIAGAALAGYFAFYTLELTFESYTYNDLSPGIFPIPLWLPQSAMAFGLVVLAIAFVDEFAELLRGRDPAYKIAEAADVEAATRNRDAHLAFKE